MTDDNGLRETMLPVKTDTSLIVIPPVSVEEAVAAFRIYQELETRLLTDLDYMYFVYYTERGYERSAKFRRKQEAEAFAEKMKGEVIRRKIKSAWRKFATFFGLTLPNPARLTAVEFYPLPENVGVVKIEKGDGWSGLCYMNAGMQVMRQEYTVSVIHPNSGKTFIGVGACAADERKSGRDSFAHPDHDIIGTAWTRAVNRAISDLVGFGEVSGEEMVSSSEETGEVVEEEVIVSVKETTSPEKPAAKAETPSKPTPTESKAIPDWSTFWKNLTAGNVTPKEASIRLGMTPQEWLNAHPGKSLADCYAVVVGAPILAPQPEGEEVKFPREAERVKVHLLDEAKRYSKSDRGKVITTGKEGKGGQVGLWHAMWGAMYPDDVEEAERVAHTFMAYVWGKTTSKELLREELQATLHWACVYDEQGNIEKGEDGKAIFDPIALTELQNILDVSAENEETESADVGEGPVETIDESEEPPNDIPF